MNKWWSVQTIHNLINLSPSVSKYIKSGKV